MKHRFVAVLLERKRLELSESMDTFAKRIYPDSEPITATIGYQQIARHANDIPEARLTYAADVLGIELELLRTI